MRIGQMINTNSFKLKESLLTKELEQKNPLLEGLEKRQHSIQEHIKKIDENENFSAKQKEKYKVDLTKQLTEVEKLIGSQKKAVDSVDSKANAYDWSDTYDFENHKKQMMNLVDMTKSLNQVKAQYRTNLELKSNARILASEVKADKYRGVDVSAKKSKLNSINGKINNLNEKITENMKKVGIEAKKIN